MSVARDGPSTRRLLMASPTIAAMQEGRIVAAGGVKHCARTGRGRPIRRIQGPSLVAFVPARV